MNIQTHILVEHPDLFVAILEGIDMGVLASLRRILSTVNLEHLYSLMKNDIIKGNFSVMYIDARLQTDKTRQMVAKAIDLMRAKCVRSYNAGVPLDRILTEYAF